MNANSKDFNYLLYDMLPAGIYNGGLLSKTPLFTDRVTVAPLTVLLYDSTIGVAVKVTTSTSEPNITISSTTPYVCFSYEWVDATSNYMNMFAASYDDVLLNPDWLVAGRGVYISGNLQSTFDYSRRSDAVIATHDTNKNAFRVQPVEAQPKRVYVNPGNVYFNNAYIQFPGGTADADITNTILGRIDLVVVDESNNVSFLLGTDSATPSVPTYPKLAYVVAEIHRAGGRDSIFGNEIVQINADRQQVTDFRWGVGLYDVNASEIPIGTAITQTVTGGTSWSYVNTSYIPNVLQDIVTHVADMTGIANDKVLDRHINWGVTDSTYVNSNNMPLGAAINITVTGGTNYAIADTTIIPTVFTTVIDSIVNASGIQNAAIVNRHIGTDAVDTTQINWGTIGNQVYADSIPILDSGGYITATTVEGALAEIAGSTYAATSSNIPNTLVKRDSNGDFAARNITAATFSGAVSASTISNSSTFSLNAPMTIARGVSANITIPNDGTRIRWFSPSDIVTSEIFDDGNFHISTDSYMYFSAPTQFYIISTDTTVSGGSLRAYGGVTLFSSTISGGAPSGTIALLEDGSNEYNFWIRGQDSVWRRDY